MDTQAKKSQMVNGMDVEGLFTTINSIKKTPVIAKFRFRVKNEGLGCGQNRTTIKNFYGAGEDIIRDKTFVLDADGSSYSPVLDSVTNGVSVTVKAERK